MGDEERQLLEQNLQGFLLQQQAFQAQLIEVESALEEVEKTSEAYKIVGTVMVAADPKALKAELEQKREMLKIRITNLEKQEAKIKEKLAEGKKR
ncbi:MAG TPA: prefoldin subunit [Candidatus Nanoarchaeia archaeon]|nr:prefoldin subunit [Candidatus Nanoarchaeia archaeon]